MFSGFWSYGNSTSYLTPTNQPARKKEKKLFLSRTKLIALVNFTTSYAVKSEARRQSPSSLLSCKLLTDRPSHCCHHFCSGELQLFYIFFINYFIVSFGICTIYCTILFISIHLIPKWRPINYSFVCKLINALCLVNMCNNKRIKVKMMQRGLINMHTKE